MNGLERRRHSRSFFDSSLTLAFFLFLATLLAVNAGRAYLLYYKSVRDEAELKKNIEDRTRENETLQAQLRRFESGEGLEFEARERLNVQKPEEHVLIIVDEKHEGEVPGKQSGEKNLWRRFTSWFKEKL